MENVVDGLVGTTAAAASVGVAGRTLRQWARDGSVTPAAWTAGGHARWNTDELRRQLAALHPAGA